MESEFLDPRERVELHLGMQLLQKRQVVCSNRLHNFVFLHFNSKSTAFKAEFLLKLLSSDPKRPVFAGWQPLHLLMSHIFFVRTVECEPLYGVIRALVILLHILPDGANRDVFG